MSLTSEGKKEINELLLCAEHDKVKDDSIKKERPYKIFFKDLFLFKENEMAAKKKEKHLNRNLKVHQKSTFSSRMKSRSHLSKIVFYSDTAGGSFENFGLDPTLVLRLTEGSDTKKTVQEFIDDQRDRFLLEYSLSTKRNTITKFDNHIATRERQLLKAETKLQEDAMAFEEFLRENDQRSVDALKIFLEHNTKQTNKSLLPFSAAQETINKLQMTAELKKASMEVQAVKSPPDSLSSEDSLEFTLDDDMDYDLEPELYFKEPEELLQVFTELEEQNLTLVQYSQDVDENLEDVNKREKLIQDKINSNIEFLLEHKEMLKANCVREEEKAAELELRSRLFNFGQFNSDAQEKLIDSLSKKINQVYKVCIGDGEVGSLNPVQKLVKVESRLVELSDLIESIPKENVEAIERIKQKERRQKLREEKMKEKQRHQEERLKAALERAVAQPKKKLGRRLIYRSKPPSGNKQELLLVKDTKSKSVEDEYFFT
ncbi:Coiled-coil domain-containing protein 38 [Pteropus alecto]|uniref:Coiled-coil domain-containing protein 38 n=1 Tax=Pteropus alecto TaxID=9402 RepID=L5KGC1_PTEAL|nr:Coiled-coil domain-containing protein 38 [Pteropus alecto]